MSATSPVSTRAPRRGGRALAHAAAVASVGAAVLGGAVLFAPGSATASDAAPTSFAEVLVPAGDTAGRFVHVATTGSVAAAAATGRMAAAAMPPPVACPVPTSEFIDSWGFSRSGGRRHKGVDMMAPHGDVVLAPVAGTIRASNSSLGGLGFWLEDLAGNTYFGSHLSTLTRTGVVDAGDVIGTVGSTGNASASGPHLHFEIMLAGEGSVNPFSYVAEWCDNGGSDAETTDGGDGDVEEHDAIEAGAQQGRR